MPDRPPTPTVSRQRLRRRTLVAAGTLAPALLWTGLPLGATAQDRGQVEQRIERSKRQESSLRTDAARLARLEKVVQRGIAVLERRQAQAQADLLRAEARLASTEGRLKDSRRRLADQQRRLARDRSTLAANLRAAYKAGGRPDLVTVVVGSRGLSDLLERADYEASARTANSRILDGVRDARRQTMRLERSLQAIVPEQRRAAAEVRQERNAVAARASALQGRRTALAQARSARLAAIRATRKDRSRARRTLSRLIAAQQRASVDRAGPGGPWAIPYAIVQCESGGQNLPPNGAGASGYYQFMPDTWKGLGGSTSDAYKAGKAEQDRLAAKLWAGGAGAGNWDCAAIVGLG